MCGGGLWDRRRGEAGGGGEGRMSNLAACVICNWLGEGKGRVMWSDVVEKSNIFSNYIYRSKINLEI